jgi:hypothetical protein
MGVSFSIPRFLYTAIIDASQLSGYKAYSASLAGMVCHAATCFINGS